MTGKVSIADAAWLDELGLKNGGANQVVYLITFSRVLAALRVAGGSAVVAVAQSANTTRRRRYCVERACFIDAICSDRVCW